MLASTRAIRPQRSPRVPPNQSSSVLAPFLESYSSALADSRFDIHFVHEPFHARQPQAQTFTGRISLLHRQIDVCDSWPVVLELKLKTGPIFALNRAPGHDAFASVFENIASKFRCGGHNSRHVRDAET